MRPNPLIDPVDGFLLGKTRGGLGCLLNITGVTQPKEVVISANIVQNSVHGEQAANCLI